VVAYYSPDTSTEVPAWSLYATTFLMWLYQVCFSPSLAVRSIGSHSVIVVVSHKTLDNLDGKQARRTGTGSPLGEIFDHGKLSF